MNKFYLLIFFVMSSTLLFGQKLETFSEDPTTFLSELETFMTASKRQQIEEVWENFEQVSGAGMFTAEELTQIRNICDQMLKLRMTASPFLPTTSRQSLW
jgi:hypothetical protein